MNLKFKESIKFTRIIMKISESVVTIFSDSDENLSLFSKNQVTMRRQTCGRKKDVFIVFILFTFCKQY